MDFEPAEREYLLWMRNLTTDNEGREIFVGLSVEESAEYFRLTRKDARARREEPRRYLELHDKMEFARLGVIMAENALRTTAPTIN